MVAFYEMVTKVEAQWLAPVFAELVLPGVASDWLDRNVPLWKEGSAVPAANRTLFIEFQVADIDAEYDLFKESAPLVHELKTLPWGNKTFQFRDPEGNAVSLYMPATEEAKSSVATAPAITSCSRMGRFAVRRFPTPSLPFMARSDYAESRHCRWSLFGIVSVAEVRRRIVALVGIFARGRCPLVMRRTALLPPA